VKSVPKNSLTIKILKAYDKERNYQMGCADHRISSVCHPHRTWGYVLHGNVGKCKNERNLVQ
jgi:hypothetical protein